MKQKGIEADVTGEISLGLALFAVASVLAFAVAHLLSRAHRRSQHAVQAGRQRRLLALALFEAAAWPLALTQPLARFTTHGIVGALAETAHAEISALSLVASLAKQTDGKPLADGGQALFAFSLVVLPAIASLAAIVLCALSFLPEAKPRLERLAQRLFWWAHTAHGYDALLVSAVAIRVDIKQVSSWILDSQFGKLCDAIDSALGEQCFEVTATLLTGAYWAAAAAAAHWLLWGLLR